jgi:molybdate transport system ATP-binding protein
VSGLVVDARVRRGAFEVDAAFEAGPGETLALLGPNGSGKSTLVAAIAGLLRPVGGRIELDGMALDADGIHARPERRPIGVVFQELRLLPHLSAIENVAFPLRARGVPRTEARARASSLLARLGLEGRGGARPADLSGGEAQRVALARALVSEPALLLLDEPLSALDVGARARAREVVLAELRRFEGVRVVITHDPVEASILADRLVLIEGGHVTQTGTIDQIRGSPRSRYAADLVGVNAIRGRLERLERGAARLVAEEGELVLPWPEDASQGDEALALLKPSDVTISLEPPSGSARNALEGRITSIAVEGERARVRIASRPPLVAEVTPGSVERLDLREGVIVWASFKAVEVQVVPS